MKKGKLIIALCLSVVVAFAFTACGVDKPYGNIKLDDYVKVGKYKGLEVKSFKVNVTEKEVNEQIKTNRQNAQTTEESKEGTVKDGDTVNIDFVGKIDGKEFEGGTGQGQTLTIGSGQFIDGFESGLVGVKVGGKKTLKLKFPKDYNNKDVAGKDVTFDVTVNSKQISIVPELNEEFVKSEMKKAKNTKVKTVAEYKEYVKKELEKQEKEQGITEQKQYLWNEVVTASSVKKDDKKKEKYPEEEVKKVEEQMTTQYEEYAKQSNMELKEFLKQQMQMDEKTFKQQIKQYAKSVVKENMLIMAIAEKEGLEVSSDEYEKFIADQLETNGFTEESFEKQNGKSFEEMYGEETIMTQLYRDKVLEFILDKAKVVDKLTKKK